MPLIEIRHWHWDERARFKGLIFKIKKLRQCEELLWKFRVNLCTFFQKVISPYKQSFTCGLNKPIEFKWIERENQTVSDS